MHIPHRYDESRVNNQVYRCNCVQLHTVKPQSSFEKLVSKEINNKHNNKTVPQHFNDS